MSWPVCYTFTSIIIIKPKGFNSSPSSVSLISRISGIIGIAAPVTFTRLIITAINSINTILIPQRLMAGGLTNSEAVSLFGIVSGMVLPLLYMPFTITNALYTVIVPHLSEDLATANWTAIRANVTRAVSITTIFAFSGIGAAVLACSSHWYRTVQTTAGRTISHP